MADRRVSFKEGQAPTVNSFFANSWNRNIIFNIFSSHFGAAVSEIFLKNCQKKFRIENYSATLTYKEVLPIVTVKIQEPKLLCDIWIGI